MAVNEALVDGLYQIDYLRIVRRRQGEQTDLFEAGLGDGLFDCVDDLVNWAFAHRVGDHSGMTEATAARAATHDLNRDAVVHSVDVGNDKTRQRGRQLGYDALDHRVGYPFTQPFHA